MGNTQSAEGEGGSRKHGIHQGGSGEGGATGHSGGGGGSLAHRLSRRSKPAAATAAVPMPTVKVSTENTTSNNQYNSQQHRRSQNKHTLGVGPVDMLSPVVGSPLPDSSLTQGLPAGMAVNKYEAGRGPIHMGMPETIPQTLPNQSGLAQMMAARKITAEETGRSPLSGISDDRIHWMGEGTGDSGLVNEKISLAGNTTDDDYDKMHNAVPTLIRWTEPCQGVYISGSFVDWQFKIKLHEDDGMFGVVLDLPVGTHRLKYIVDGKWRCSNRFIIAPDEDGNLVNYFKVESVVKEIDQEKEDNVEGLDAATLSNSLPGEYGIAIPDLDKIARESSNSRRNEPPLLPPHLNQVLLNSLEIRHDDPNVLPVPNHVVLNHLYACSIKNNVMAVSSTSRYRDYYSMSNNNNNRGRYQPYRGASTGRGRGGGGGGGGRGRGRGMGERQEGGDHHSSGKPSGGGPGHLVPVKPTIPSPASTMTWRVLYAVPPNSRPEVGPSGERIPGPFSPPLRPSTPEQPITGFRKPQDELRKENETFVMKQRVQQLLQQAANSPSGGMGTYVGKLSQNNNSLIPVLPRFDN